MDDAVIGVEDLGTLDGEVELSATGWPMMKASERHAGDGADSSGGEDGSDGGRSARCGGSEIRKQTAGEVDEGPTPTGLQ